MSIDIKILGAQCGKCERLYNRVQTYIEKNSIDASLAKIDEIEALSQYNSYCLPVLIINNQIVCKGIVPSESELNKYFSKITSAKNIDQEIIKPTKRKYTFLIVFTLILLFFSIIFIFNNNGNNKPLNKATVLSINDSLNMYYDHVLFQRPYQISILEFGSGFCKQCILMQSVMDSLRQKYSPVLYIECINLRKKENRRIAKAYNIVMIPAQVILDRRGNIIHSHTGFLPEDSIKSIIFNHFMQKK